MNLQVSHATMGEALSNGSAPVALEMPSPRRKRDPRAFESDASYFKRRADEERVFASQQSDPRCRALHIELADRYASLSAAIREAKVQIG
nr:hypothetical protein [uncultured Sphingomonas sp.]